MSIKKPQPESSTPAPTQPHTPIGTPQKQSESATLISEDYQRLYDQQQATIKKEIEEEPLIGPSINLSIIIEEYMHNQNFLTKICDLFDNRNKTGLRKIRKDGSCFYRGFIFRLAEILNADKSLFAKFHLFEKIGKAAPMMVEAGFQTLVFESFEGVFRDFMTGIQQGLVRKEDLHTAFDDKQMFDYYVMYLRFVISAYIRTHKELFEMYFETPEELLQFCQREVEPIDSEADQIQIVAMFNYFEIPIRIFYLDNSNVDKATCLSLPELEDNTDDVVAVTDAEYPIQLLYKPGHYDIIY